MGELVPFGAPWRAGANEATVVRSDRSLRVGDVRLEAGWYSLYVVPEPESWTLVLNRLADREGDPIDGWVRSHDVGELVAPLEDPGTLVQDLTIRFEPGPPGTAWMVIEWERSRVRASLRVEGGEVGGDGQTTDGAHPNRSPG